MGGQPVDFVKLFTPYFKEGDPSKYSLACHPFVERANRLLGDTSLRNWEKYRELYRLRNALRRSIDFSPHLDYRSGLIAGNHVFLPAFRGILNVESGLSGLLDRNVYQPLLFSGLSLLAGTIYMVQGLLRHRWSKLGLRRRQLIVFPVMGVLLLLIGWRALRKQEHGEISPLVCDYSFLGGGL